MEKVCEAVLIEIDIEKFRKAMAEIDMEEAREAMLAKISIDIEKVREAALSHFKDLPSDQQEVARSFFRAMDKDKNGSINVEEFRTFLTRAEFKTENCDRVFKELDKDQDGTLDFEELVTFFYVLSCDEYKPLFSRAYTGRPDRKAENGLPTAGATDGGQRSNRDARVRKILEWLHEKARVLFEESQ